MTKVYIIRHAEAEGNLYRRGHGHYNSSVTPRGLKQIDALARRFKDVHVDALYSSDLKRTMTTAGAITKYHDLELHTTERLREVNMGIWEDLTWGELERDNPEQLINFMRYPDKWEIEGGEKFDDLAVRITSVIREIAEENDGKTVVIVSHGMAIRTFIAEVLGIDSADASQVAHADNTSVSLLEYDGGEFHVCYYNDNSHLTEDISTFARQNWWKSKMPLGGSNLLFEPLRLECEGELYVQCYRDAWMQSHASDGGFMPELCLSHAEEHSEYMPEALMKVTLGGEFAGVIELDPENGRDIDVGWITLCYLRPEYRGKGFAAQLLGHAVSVYRRLGRKSLRLHVSARNEQAIGFYESYGFQKIGSDNGVYSVTYLMEKIL